MNPPEELWRVDFSVTYQADQRILHGCECFLTRAEADLRVTQMKTSPQKYEIKLSHYRKVSE